jgi:hypothetical protein
MAYSDELDPAVPDNTDQVSDGAAVIREFKRAVIERLESFFTDLDVDPLTGKAGAAFDGALTIAGALIGATTGAFSAAVTLTGAAANLVLATAGSGIKIAEGSNATMGTGTLSGGTVTISTTKVTANSRIFLSYYGTPGVSPSPLFVSARSAGTSFDVSNAGSPGSGTFVWMIVEPS